MDEDKKFTLRPHPELFLIDPVTGVLPPNYKEILLARSLQKSEDSTSANEDKHSKVDLKSLFKNLEAELEAARNEPLRLDGVASGSKPATKTLVKVRIFNKGGQRLSKNIELKSSASRKSKSGVPKNSLPPKSTPLSKPRTSNLRNPRKVLFTEQTRNAFPVSRKPKSENPVGIDDTLPLLDISEMENKLLPPKQKYQKPSTFVKPKSVLKKKSTNIIDTSASSLEEFLKSEQACKTPKKSSLTETTVMGKTEETQLEQIIKKLDNLQSDMNKIKSDMNKIKSDVSVILNHFNLLNNGTQINNHTKSDNLRMQTLEKQFLQKKVLFDIQENNENDNVSRSILKPTIVQTPNTLLRHVKEIAEAQYSMTKGTPRL